MEDRERGRILARGPKDVLFYLVRRSAGRHHGDEGNARNSWDGNGLDDVRGDGLVIFLSGHLELLLELQQLLLSKGLTLEVDSLALVAGQLSSQLRRGLAQDTDIVTIEKVLVQQDNPLFGSVGGELLVALELLEAWFRNVRQKDKK